MLNKSRWYVGKHKKKVELCINKYLIGKNASVF